MLPDGLRRLWGGAYRLLERNCYEGRGGFVGLNPVALAACQEEQASGLQDVGFAFNSNQKLAFDALNGDLAPDRVIRK